MAESLYGRKPVLSRAVFEFVQDGNTLGTTSESEYLTICFETQLPGEKPFAVIETSGWSSDGADLSSLTLGIANFLRRYQSCERT